MSDEFTLITVNKLWAEALEKKVYELEIENARLRDELWELRWNADLIIRKVEAALEGNRE